MVLSKILQRYGTISVMKSTVIPFLTLSNLGVSFLASKFIGIDHAQKLFTVLEAAIMLYTVPTLYRTPWQFNVLSARLLMETIENKYFLLSHLRVYERMGIQFHNSLVDDVTPEERDREYHLLKKQLRFIDGMASSITKDNRIAFFTIKTYFQDLAKFYDLKIYPAPLYLIYPSIFPTNQMFGSHQAYLEILLKQQINNYDDAEYYINRVAKADTFIEAMLKDLKERRSSGVLPPIHIFEVVIQQIKKKVIDKSMNGGDNFLVTRMTESLDQIIKDGKVKKDPARIKKLVERLEKTLSTKFVPAFQKLLDFLIESKLEAKMGDGLWRIPNGDEIYQHYLKYSTTTNLSAVEIHNLGLREVARIKKEMIELVRDEYPSIDSEGSQFGETVRSISNEERFQLGEGDEGRALILEGYKKIVEDIKPKLVDLFERFPEVNVDVERVPYFKEEDCAPAYYHPPPLDRSRNGVFYVNLRETTSHSLLNMKDLCYHEAIPGHHYQIALTQELKIDLFRRNMILTAYAEGWGLYVEQLADEQGWYENKWERLGFLISEIWRAARLVIDTGIHSGEYRWSRQQAIDYMSDNTGLNMKDIVAEVERYMVLPGQACAYKIGQLKIIELRELAKQRLGSLYSIKKFHSTILHCGALPLDILEIHVNDWIDSTLNENKKSK
eukprot:gene9728-11946_t